MNFSNLIFFQFPPMHPGTFAPQMREEGGAVERLPSLLLQGAEECRAKPVGPMEIAGAGFVAPFGGARANERLIEEGDDHLLITIEFSRKLLPASAINERLQQRLAEFEQANGRKPGGRMRRQMRDDILQEMLPTALVVRKRVDALIYPELGLIAVDTASRRTAEEVVSHVRAAIGSFPALPLMGNASVTGVLTGWLSGDAMPDTLSIGHECVLEDPAHGGGRVAIRDMDLASEEVTGHLEAGRIVRKLALHQDGIATFTLQDDLGIRKVRIEDAAWAAMEDQDRETLDAELGARMLVRAAAVKSVFSALTAPFALERPQ